MRYGCVAFVCADDYMIDMTWRVALCFVACAALCCVSMMAVC